MLVYETTATKKIWQLHKRLRGISGGTGASKTISILIWCIVRALQNKDEVISVVSEFLPALKRGAIRDFLSIMVSHNLFVEENWNKTDFIYTFPTGSKIEFFSADQGFKVRGPRRDILFINEANNIDYETYTQLEVRTNKIIWMDWNPTSEFWWYTEVVPYNDVDFITLTYKDNEALDQTIIQSIESRRHNVNWYKVYGLGELGEAEAKIYKGWAFIDQVPQQARLERYGLDFGYSNDPTAIVAVFYYNGVYIFDELCYRTGMSNHQIAVFFKMNPRALIIPDSSEPKSIAEIKEYKLPILPAFKGKDSVNYGIQYIQEQKIAVTKRSVNLIKEYRNYFWQTDSSGKILNIPEEGFDHCMDAIRYALVGRRRIDQKVYGGPVKYEGERKHAPPLVANAQGAFKSPDFWTAFKEEQAKRRSTSAVEFHR